MNCKYDINIFFFTCCCHHIEDQYNKSVLNCDIDLLLCKLRIQSDKILVLFLLKDLKFFSAFMNNFTMLYMLFIMIKIFWKLEKIFATIYGTIKSDHSSILFKDIAAIFILFNFQQASKFSDHENTMKRKQKALKILLLTLECSICV